jgi:hypothetical protein
MDALPDLPEPEYTQVQDDLAPGYRPRHPRAREAWGEHRLARGLRNAGPDGQPLTALVPLPHPMGPFFEVGVALGIALGRAPQPGRPAHGRGRWSHPREAVGCGLQTCPHLFGPCLALPRRAQEGLRAVLDGEAGVVGVDQPYPPKGVPGALGIGHRFYHTVIGIAWMVPIIPDRDQPEAVAVDLTHQGLEQGRPLGGERGLTGLWHLPQIHGPPLWPRRSMTDTVAVAPSCQSPWRSGPCTPSRPPARGGCKRPCEARA